MSRYIKKPVVIVDAIQFSGINIKEILRFIYPDMTPDKIREHIRMDLPLMFETSRGCKTVLEGNYVIKDRFGYISTMTAKFFEASYEKIDLREKPDATVDKYFNGKG